MQLLAPPPPPVSGSRSDALAVPAPRYSSIWPLLLEGVRSRFGRTYAGEPDKIADELAADEAVLAADTVLFTVPNQLGVEYNARILDTIARHIAPAIGWRPAGAATAS